MKSAAKQNNLSPAQYNKKFNTLVKENRRQLVEDHRQQIEALLTPQQLSALTDFNLHKEMAWALLSDKDTLKRIDATQTQRTTLRQLIDEARKQQGRAWEEATKRALKLLTPHQHDLLHEKFDQEGWW